MVTNKDGEINCLTINERFNMFLGESAEIYIVPYLDKSDHIKM